jgi:hypothetical protein
MPGKTYEPALVTVLVGTTMTWRNSDSTNHTVTAETDAFDSGYLAPGSSFAYTFAKQGHYAYHCQIHKFMKGEVDVFSLVLTGPERPVGYGRQVVVAGLAPAGTTSVTLARVDSKDEGQTVKARPDGSFTVRFPATAPGLFRALAGKGASPIVRVEVVPHVTATRTGSTIQVRTVPSRTGAHVALQSYDREHFTWRTIAHTPLDSRSRASVVVPKGRPIRLRVVVRGTNGWANGATPAMLLR